MYYICTFIISFTLSIWKYQFWYNHWSDVKLILVSTWIEDSCSRAVWVLLLTNRLTNLFGTARSCTQDWKSQEASLATSRDPSRQSHRKAFTNWAQGRDPRYLLLGMFPIHLASKNDSLVSNRHNTEFYSMSQISRLNVVGKLWFSLHLNSSALVPISRYGQMFIKKLNYKMYCL